MINKDAYETIGKIMKRAEKMGLLFFDKFSFLMDFELAFDKFNLKLEDLLQADDYNFSHDVCGIQNNINRKTKTFNEFFLPRFAGE